ncbi:hypothetical protein DMH88_04295 [Escherichia coli]|nr:hypothetical protein [Escherichia coli]
MPTVVAENPFAIKFLPYCLNGLTVVVSPLISLMKDQVDQLQANGVAAACLNSTQTREQQLEVMTGCRTGEIRLLYIAPERLMLDNFLEHLAHWNPVLLAVDEAHCIPCGATISPGICRALVSCASVSRCCRLWR